jgi:hypothetical protein
MKNTISNPTEIIIVGGGESIKQANFEVLKPLLSSKCTFLTNYSYKHFPGTLMAFVDRNFYVPLHTKKEPEANPDIYEELKTLPLIVGIDHSGVSEFKLPNTYLVKSSMQLKKIKSISQGLYTKHFLTGVMAMSLACFLMDYSGIIYLLGFDYNKEGNTHYYPKEEINHQGQGWIASYATHNPDNIFKSFNKFENIKIYNVSPNSRIENFEKITYEQMYQLLNKEIYNQHLLRVDIRRKLDV